MKQISHFYTLFWIIYFPTCIAYNDLPFFSSIDEIMTFVLIGFTWKERKSLAINYYPWKEYKQFLLILFFYCIYSLVRAINVADSVFLEFLQQIRPYSVIYCTWILNPRFSQRQKQLMLTVMVLTLMSWVVYHPVSSYEIETGQTPEFPVLGQLAICTGMSWYLFTTNTQKNKKIALLIVCTGLIAPKFKFIGELICFVAVLFFMKNRMNFKTIKTFFSILSLVSIVLFVTWSRFDVYYVSGFKTDDKARPKSYKTALKILVDYFPFGPGMGTFATNGAWKNYSPLYYKYDLDTTWGLGPGGGFICDAFYPSLSQYGVGVFFFFVFWKRRLVVTIDIRDIKYYRISIMAFLCLAIEQTADSSILSGKGMGYCMLFALGLNANQNYTSEKTIEHLEEQSIC